jgi:hypothetical protein
VFTCSLVSSLDTGFFTSGIGDFPVLGLTTNVASISVLTLLILPLNSVSIFTYLSSLLEFNALEKF